MRRSPRSFFSSRHATARTLLLLRRTPGAFAFGPVSFKAALLEHACVTIVITIQALTLSRGYGSGDLIRVRSPVGATQNPPAIGRINGSRISAGRTHPA